MLHILALQHVRRFKAQLQKLPGRTRAAEDLVDGGELLAGLGAGCRRLGEGQQRLVQDLTMHDCNINASNIPSISNLA